MCDKETLTNEVMIEGNNHQSSSTGGVQDYTSEPNQQPDVAASKITTCILACNFIDYSVRFSWKYFMALMATFEWY